MATSGTITKDFRGVTISVPWSYSIADFTAGTGVVKIGTITFKNTTSASVSIVDIVGMVDHSSVEYDDTWVGSTQLCEGPTVKGGATVTKAPSISTLTVEDFTVSNNYLHIGSFHAGSVVTLGDVQLDALAPISTPTVPASATIGTAFTVTTNRKHSSYTHTLRFKVGSTTVHTVNNVGESASVTIPASAANSITTSTSATCTLECVTNYTVDGTSQTGTTTKTFTLNVPASYKPSISNVKVTDSSGALTKFGVLLANKSNVTFSGTETPSYGSAIASRSVTIGDKTFNTNSVGVFNLSTLPFSGNATMTITDRRGRTGSGTVAINVLAYTPPTMSNPQIFRSTSTGALDSEGQRISILTPYTKTSINNKNFVKREIYVDDTLVATDGNTTNKDATQKVVTLNGTYSNQSIFNVKVVLTDTVGSSTTFSSTISTAIRPLSIRKDGTGLSIGKICQQAGFNVGWDSEFDGNVQVDGNAIIKGSTYGVEMFGTENTNGYIRVGRITISGSNIDMPLVFTFIRRLDYCSTTAIIRFNASSGTDPTLSYIRTFGHTQEVYIVKADTSKWDVYITKSGPNGHISILSINSVPYFAKRASFELDGSTQVSSLPSGYTKATLAGSISYALNAGSATNATTATNSNKLGTYPITSPGSRFTNIPITDVNGMTKIGKAIYFYYNNTDTDTPKHILAVESSGKLSGNGVINSNNNLQIKGENIAYVAGDQISGDWSGGGYITTSGSRLRFCIPITKPIIGTLNVVQLSITVRQNNKYIFGDADEGFFCWYNGAREDFYADSTSTVTKTINGIDCNIVMKNKGNTPINNDACGVLAEYTFTVS